MANSGWTIIGNNGNGMLVVSDNGVLSGSSFFELGRNAGSEGTLVIGTLPGSDALAPGSLENISGINVGAGTGHFVFNHTGTDFQFNHNLDIDSHGKADVSVLSGTTTLTTTAWSGDTILTGGKLILGSRSSLGSGNLTFNGGTLDLGTENKAYSVKQLTLSSGELDVSLDGVTV
ncbi:hypothetical protein [Escherichia coli]|uniref:hypothetical protein n=1 Tax=Escherichia coli TaxID=562 RepID=UPI0003F190A9|nr:hypothetical protein [Escherichia coli]